MIDKRTVASIEFTLSWESCGIQHTDSYFARKVSFYRDILPQKVADCLLEKITGEVIEFQGVVKEIVSPYAEDNEFSIEKKYLDRFYTTQEDIHPRFGRFYPKGLLKGLPGIFRGNLEPFRCTGVFDKTIIVDLNHPLSQKDGNLTVTIRDLRRKSGEIGGSCTDWPEIITSGPGMQKRCRGTPTDFFADEPFTRTNESDDIIFYREPRLVTHIDDQAASVIRNVYRKILKNGSRVLDLMSSWRSHIPQDLKLNSLVGLGLNGEEMSQNPQLSSYVIHDLNRYPVLPFADHEFDAVICTVSVEYLKHPFEVFREIARILKPNRYFILTFSNRWFQQKVIRIWTELHEFERMGLVLEYFLQTGLYKDLNTYSLRGLPRNEDDKYYPQISSSDPIYAVWGQKG
ncbi:MAG: methyltransferase domain-containing protein [Nitrospirota bacterium]